VTPSQTLFAGNAGRNEKIKKGEKRIKENRRERK